MHLKITLKCKESCESRRAVEEGRCTQSGDCVQGKNKKSRPIHGPAFNYTLITNPISA